MDAGQIAQLAGQAMAAIITTLAVRSRQATPAPAALPAPAEPRVECTCNEAMITRAIAASIDHEEVKALIRQALYDHIKQAERTHTKLDQLDDLTRLLITLSERATHISSTVEAIRSQREQITPPLGLKR